MKSIVILGERYSKNLGDGVICQCVEGLVKKYAREDDSVVCIDLSCRENYGLRNDLDKKWISNCSDKIMSCLLSIPGIQQQFVRKMGKSVYTYWTWERRDRAIVRGICARNHATDVIFAGGELFKDYFLFYMKYFVTEYGKTGSRIWFNACGCDANNTDYVTRAFRKVLGSQTIHRITTRSLPESCKALITPERYSFVPDPAICAADFFEKNPTHEAQVGLGIMAIDDLAEKKDELLAFWSEVVRQLEKMGLSYKLFTNGALEDYQFAQELVAYLNIEEEKLLPQPQTPEGLIRQITAFDEICAFRMHSVIIAYAFQIPFAGFAWDQKIRDFSKYIGQEEQIVDWEKIDAADVVQIMHSCKFIQGKLEQLKSVIYAEFENELGR